MKTKTVLVCHGNTVLDLGILSVLNSAGCFNLAHTVCDSSDQFQKDIEINQPDVIVFSQGARITHDRLYQNLPIKVPPICLLTICIESNYICLNKNRIVKIHKASDIIELILSNIYLT